MSKVRKRRQAISQEFVGTNDPGHQTLPVSEMSSEVPKIQVCIVAAARSSATATRLTYSRWLGRAFSDGKNAS